MPDESAQPQIWSVVMSTEKQGVDGSRLLKAVEVIAISPEQAKRVVSQYMVQVTKKHPELTETEVQKKVAKKIIHRY